MKKFILFFVALLCASFIEAKVTLPQLFQSGMVMQRGKAIPVWGKADAGETVIIKFNKKQYSVKADADGKWRIDLPKMKAGGPYTLGVRGENLEVREISDILIGDVWLLSGQSNIDVHIERVYPQYAQEVDNYENDQIRLFRVQNDTDVHGVRDDIRPTSINWKPLNKKNAWPFSAVGYFLGKRMFEKNKVAQGIIVNSWGGTPIEAWISKDSLERDYPMLVKRAQFFQNDDYVKAQAQANMQAERQWQKILQESDPGILQNWTSADYDDSAWQVINQWNWGWRGTGTVWLRQHIIIDKVHAQKPARLLLGTLFDRDITYLNGQQIGQTGYQYPPRRYDIPEGLLREGDNVITVRFINKYGMVHFIPEKPYLIAFGDDRCSQNPMPKDVIPLSEEWKFSVGAEMPSCPSGDISLQNIPTTLFNAVLYPLAPYAISGVVWYQGESNADSDLAVEYAPLLRLMIANWRQAFERPQLPFVIIQLANYREPSEQPQNTGWSVVREAQRLVAKEDSYAELAVTIDRGETVDIHPLRKKDVAERVALAFERLLWNPRVTLSPEVVKAVVDNGLVVCTLSQSLKDDGKLYEFEVAGADGRYVNAEAEGRGDRIIIKSSVPNPVSVRYAWKNNPIRANVYGRNGLPMSPFTLRIKDLPPSPPK